ncbi:MAG: hypothetical protein HQ582_21495 [Planctomycetes bacterium]|nr:hypothetical protein [Planctomycetota bacterium]
MKIEPGSVKVAVDMAVLGVLARLHVPQRRRIVDALESLHGVSTFSVEEEERIGILIEASSLDGAHATLIAEVEKVHGILGAWPVFAHAEPDCDPRSEARPVPGRTALQGAGDGKDTP